MCGGGNVCGGSCVEGERVMSVLQLNCWVPPNRPACGIRKSTIIVNLPGSRKGSQVAGRTSFINPPVIIRLCA